MPEPSARSDLPCPSREDGLGWNEASRAISGASYVLGALVGVLLVDHIPGVGGSFWRSLLACVAVAVPLALAMQVAVQLWRRHRHRQLGAG